MPARVLPFPIIIAESVMVPTDRNSARGGGGGEEGWGGVSHYSSPRRGASGLTTWSHGGDNVFASVQMN